MFGVFMYNKKNILIDFEDTTFKAGSTSTLSVVILDILNYMEVNKIIHAYIHTTASLKKQCQGLKDVLSEQDVSISLDTVGKLKEGLQ